MLCEFRREQRRLHCNRQTKSDPIYSAGVKTKIKPAYASVHTPHPVTETGMRRGGIKGRSPAVPEWPIVRLPGLADHEVNCGPDVIVRCTHGATFWWHRIFAVDRAGIKYVGTLRDACLPGGLVSDFWCAGKSGAVAHLARSVVHRLAGIGRSPGAG